MNSYPKVILIGLDGATWDIIKPMADRGELPAFKNLMKKGAWGKLHSTNPPVTFPAWESIFTGQNPGKLGVFDFAYIDKKNRSVRINTPSSFKGKPLWKILNKFGYKTCMINIPTSKVQSVNGIMVGGLFSEGNATYPENFKNILKEIDYDIYPPQLTQPFMESSKAEPSCNLIKKTISSRFELADYLIKKEKPDFLAFVIFSIDNIQHFFWNKKLMFDAWKVIDKNLSSFISRFNESTFIIVSDHGFTTLKTTFYISKFLEERGYTHYKKTPSTVLNKINQSSLIDLTNRIRLDKIILKFFSREKLQLILSFLPSKEGRIGAKGLEKIIDWENSKCIPISLGVYFNCDKNEREDIKRDLKMNLEQLNGIVKTVHFRENIYSGKFIDLAPDILIEPEEGVRILETPFAPSMITDKDSRNWSGTHASDGIFLLLGPRINNIKTTASVFDIAPTILSLFGLPPDEDMDGTVIDVALKNIEIRSKDELEKLNIDHKIRQLRDKI